MEKRTTNQDEFLKWMEQENTAGEYDELIDKFKHQFTRKALVVGMTYEPRVVGSGLEAVQVPGKVITYYHVIVRSPQQSNDKMNFTVKKLTYTKLINQFDEFSFSVKGLEQYFAYLKRNPNTKFLSHVYQNAALTKEEVRALQKSTLKD